MLVCMKNNCVVKLLSSLKDYGCWLAEGIDSTSY